MQIRLYLDEDSMSRSLARELRARGIDVFDDATGKSLDRADRLRGDLLKSFEPDTTIHIRDEWSVEPAG